MSEFGTQMSPDELKLAAALVRMSEIEPEHAEILELYIFGKETYAQIGHTMGVSAPECGVVYRECKRKYCQNGCG